MARAEETDEQLLAGCRTDPDAFGIFYRRHVRAVLAFLHSRTRRAELAADLCAETFARALERASSFDPARAPARAWLLVMASSLLVDSARRGQVEQRARQRLGMPAHTLTDEDLERIEEIVAVEQGPDLPALVADLPPYQREALLARIVDERSYSAIAKDLRVSEAVVRQRVSRGLSTLRTRLGDATP